MSETTRAVGRAAPPLIAKAALAIQAPVSAVWTVLTTVRSFAEWDDLPDQYPGEEMALGSELIWNREDGGYTKLTVSACEPGRHLRLSLYASSWPLPPFAYDVGYDYALADRDDHTLLSIEVGDFVQIPRGPAFHEASLEFVARASCRIKALSEDAR